MILLVSFITASKINIFTIFLTYDCQTCFRVWVARKLPVAEIRVDGPSLYTFTFTSALKISSSPKSFFSYKLAYLKVRTELRDISDNCMF